MKTVVSVKNQTIFDIAIQEYGNNAAFEEILTLNPNLKNDYSSAVNAGIFYASDEFDFSYPLAEGSKIIVDQDSILVINKVKSELTQAVSSFDQLDLEV